MDSSTNDHRESPHVRRGMEDLVAPSTLPEAWLRVTLDSIGDAVIATDTQGRVNFLNSIAEELTGWSSSDALGQRLETVFNILNEHTRKVVENPVERVLRE